MLKSRQSKLIRQFKRAMELAPELLRTPSRIRGVVNGLHPGTLVTLDKPWIRQLSVDVVLDVGANNGQFAQVALHVFPAARVICFEPLPECVEFLSRRLAMHPRIEILPTAVGNQDGTVIMHQSTSSPSSSILPMTEEHASAFPWTAGGADIEVPIHRLDYFLPNLELSGLVLLKIDVQGFGLEVLRGAQATLAHVDYVIIETSFVPLYDGEPGFDEIYFLMRQAGFAFEGLLDQLDHPETRKCLQGDAIFRRTG